MDVYWDPLIFAAVFPSLSINAILTPSLPPSSPPVSQAGDVLNLLKRISGDWYSGENTRTGDFGDFPASSVRVIEPLP